jgi:excisionase family DNA binding protein
LILETPKQLAARVGLRERQIRSLIDSGKLEFVMIGKRVHIPDGAFERFIEENRVTKCQDETKVPNFNGAKLAEPITSCGPSTVAVAGARLVRQTANKLKSSSRNGCKQEPANKAQVIPLKP